MRINFNLGYFAIVALTLLILNLFGVTHISATIIALIAILPIIIVLALGTLAGIIYLILKALNL